MVDETYSLFLQSIWKRTRAIFSDDFSEVDIPDQTGKVAIITGATSGLGLSSAIALAKKNAHVIIGARSDSKGKTAVETIKKSAGFNGVVEYGVVEQSDLKSVKKFSEWFLAKKIPLHVLMCNAGVCMAPFELIDGVESTMLVNHVSHQYLVTLLLDKLKESQPSRIVFVSSDAHLLPKCNTDWSARLTNASFNSARELFTQYGYTKLANVLTAVSVSKMVGDSKIFCNSVHPGFVMTNISNVNAGISEKVTSMIKVPLSWVFYSKEQGALTQLYAATHPNIELNGWTGKYFVPFCIEQTASPYARDESSRQALWETTQDSINRIMSQ